MHLPDVPYMPLRLMSEERDFLNSLEGKIEHILIGRKEGEVFSVLGYTEGRMKFVPCEPYLEEREVGEYVTIDLNLNTKEVREERGKGVYNYTSGEGLLLMGTLGMYGIVRAFSPQQFARERFQQEFYGRAVGYLQENKADLKREVEQIPIYEGPLMDVERRLGKKLEFIDLQRPDQFLSCRDTFWLRVEAARRGADMVIQYTPGSAVGTPVRVRRGEVKVVLKEDL